MSKQVTVYNPKNGAQYVVKKSDHGVMFIEGPNGLIPLVANIDYLKLLGLQVHVKTDA